MNPFAALFAPAIRGDASTTLSTPANFLLEALGGGRNTSAGIAMSEAIAERLTGVYSCLRILSETVAQLPCKLKVDTANGRADAVDHPVYELLHDMPNPEMTASEFFDQQTHQLASNGNAYAQIQRDAITGRPVALWPLISGRMEPPVRSASNALVYRYKPESGETQTFVWDRAVPARRLPPLMHVRINARDGIHGRSPLGVLRESLGLTKAAEEFGALFFSNNGVPPAFLVNKTPLKPDAQKVLEAQIMAQKGLGRAHKLKLLHGTFELLQAGVPPEQAQLLLTRSFQLAEIARIYRIPLHMLQHMEKSTSWGSGIEQLGLAFLTYTMMPYLVRWQQAFYRDLLLPDERARYTGVFVVNSLVRGDIRTRYEAYARARQNGWMNGNEIRALEDMNTVDDPAVANYWQPTNMTADPVAYGAAAADAGGASAGAPLPIVEHDDVAA